MTDFGQQIGHSGAEDGSKTSGETTSSSGELRSKGSKGAISASPAGALAVDDLRTVFRAVLREELPRILGDLLGGHEADLLDVPAAARRLGLGKSTIRKKAAACELPSVKVGTRLLFRRADLDRWTEEHRRAPEKVKALAKAVIGGDHA